MPNQTNAKHTNPRRKLIPPRQAKQLNQTKQSKFPAADKPGKRNRGPRRNAGMSYLAATGGSGHRHIRSSNAIGAASRHNIVSSKGSHAVSIYQPTKPTQNAAASLSVPGSNSKITHYNSGLSSNVVPTTITAGVRGNHFYDFATGIYKRIKRARLSLCDDDYTAYDLMKTSLFASYTEALTAIEVYLYERYVELYNATPITAPIPRNIAFLLKLLARDNWYIHANVRQIIFLKSTYAAQSVDMKTKISKLLENNYLAYSLTNVISTTCKPFVSSYTTDVNGKKSHEFVVYRSQKFSSVYSFYQDKTNEAPLYSNCSSHGVNPAHWPIICTLSTMIDHTASVPSNNPLTYPNYTVSPDVLRQWVAYDDNLFDEEYALTTTWSGANELLSTDPTFWETKYNIYPGTEHFSEIFAAPTLDKMNQIIKFARQVYAPFLHVATFTSSDALKSFAICSQFKGPMHIPSVIHELIVGNTSCLSLSLNRDNKPWRGKFFHMPNPDSEVFKITDILDFQAVSQQFYSIRHFVKTNSFPEATPSKAIIPSFFLEYPDLEGDTVLYYTPYSYQYIDAHNLSSLATNLYWPILNEVNSNVLASLNLACTIPKDQRDDVNYVDYLMFDFSFQSDSSEIDHYLHEVRINYLGGFGFLSGLLNKAKHFGNSVINNVIKPALKNPLVQTIVHVGSEALGGPGVANMIDAGISSITTTPPGPPNNVHSLDLNQ